MLKFYKIMFFNLMILGTLITVSSFSWMSLWIGLEMNLLSIIPIFKSSKNLYPNEAALKYFITQTLASTVFIMIMITYEIQFLPQIDNTHLIYVIQLVMLLKLGMAPLHFWFPEVIEGLSWSSSSLMLTWQKIAPMVIIMMTLKISMILTLSIIISSLLSGLLSMNQNSMRKIMAYSSMNHMSWMLSAMFSYTKIWLLYLCLYMMMVLNLIYMLFKSNIFYINQFKTIYKCKMSKFIINLNLLSLGGLPPLIGFLPKWLTISFLMDNENMLLPLILIITTLISLFVYLRLMFSSMVLVISENKIAPKTKNKAIFFMFNFVYLFSLIISNLLIKI